MPSCKKYNSLKRKFVPTSPIIAKRKKQYMLRENAEKSLMYSTNVADIQQKKDVYDQRVFESKSTLDSMVNSISTNHETMGRIREEKNELRRQARREQESYNQMNFDYKTLEAETDHRN
jgi:hypothetical protein